MMGRRVLPPRPAVPSPTREQRLEAARQLAQWELGSRSWADRIIGAYEHPEETLDYLRRERGEDK